MKKSSECTHGNVVWDPSAYPHLKKFASRHGWKVKSVSKQHQSLDDPTIAKLYSRNNAVLFTNDHTVYEDHPNCEGFAGYIEQEYCSEEALKQYEIKVEKFFATHKSRDVAGYVIRIPIKGNPLIKKELKK